MKIVLDTKVLVSGLLSSQGAPAAVLRSLLAGDAAVCFDERILSEYRGVLARDKFGLDADQGFALRWRMSADATSLGATMLACGQICEQEQ